MPKRSKDDRLDNPGIVVIINDGYAYLIEDGKGRYHALKKAITIHRNRHKFLADWHHRMLKNHGMGKIETVDEINEMREIKIIRVYEVETDYDEEDEIEVDGDDE